MKTPKTLTWLALSLMTLSGCQYFPGSDHSEESSQPVASSLPAQEAEDESQTSSESLSSESTSSQEELPEDSQPEEDSNSSTGLFQEETLGRSQYTAPSKVPGITSSELLPAMEEYYLEHFTQTEQEANRKRVPNATIYQLAERLQMDPELAALEVDVDQVAFELGNETLYVARVVVPMAFQEAYDLVPDNDYRLLNEALSELTPRLVMITYYNPVSDEILPVHLTNSNHSLFYYDPLTQTE